MSRSNKSRDKLTFIKVWQTSNVTNSLWGTCDKLVTWQTHITIVWQTRAKLDLDKLKAWSNYIPVDGDKITLSSTSRWWHIWSPTSVTNIAVTNHGDSLQFGQCYGHHCKDVTEIRFLSSKFPFQGVVWFLCNALCFIEDEKLVKTTFLWHH